MSFNPLDQVLYRLPYYKSTGPESVGAKSRVGEVVAVAWEDDWYVGEVQEKLEGGGRVAKVLCNARSQALTKP